ncbi:MAG: HAMP domain-containing sensor histidine kinase, partial [Myxococcota bacterium]
ALGLLALALVFYRDYARRMREAAQRVGFVTQVSHELKTPLTNIRLYAELLDDDLDGLLAAVAAGDSDDHGDSSSDEDDAIRGRTAVIIAESQRLTRLINNILTFSKQRRGQLDLRLERVAVRALVDQVLAQFGPALQARGIAAEIAVPDDLTVYADRDALGQIIANLLSNVDKYAAAGGRVEIAAGRRGARAWLRVSDRGPGIPAAHRDKIFRPFYRMSDKLADGVTGTGIGLAIARELARRLGGELRLVARDECGEHDAQSERDGASTSGACFELELDSADEPGQGERS